MSADNFAQIAGLESTFSAREAALILGRSFSWLDQRVRNGDFVLRNGTVVEPLRTDGGYRLFTGEMLQEIAMCCYRRGWFSLPQLRSAFRELAVAVYGDTGKGEVPS